MIFIVDVNVIMSALIKEGVSRALLIDSPFTLYSPDTLLSSVNKYRQLITDKSDLSEEEFETLFNLIIESIRVIQEEKYNSYLPEAHNFLDILIARMFLILL